MQPYNKSNIENWGAKIGILSLQIIFILKLARRIGKIMIIA